MIHEQLNRNDTIETSSDRSFGFVFSAFFFIVAIFPCLQGGLLRYWALFVSLLILIIAFLYPASLAYANKYWQKLGLFLGMIMTPVIMGILFYLVLTPIALIRGKSRFKALGLNFDKDLPTYWVFRQPPGPEPKSLKQQF